MQLDEEQNRAVLALGIIAGVIGYTQIKGQLKFHAPYYSVITAHLNWPVDAILFFYSSYIAILLVIHALNAYERYHPIASLNRFIGKIRDWFFVFGAISILVTAVVSIIRLGEILFAHL